MQQERARTGRLYSHLKLIEMKNFIRDIRRTEGSLKEEAKSTEDQVLDILRTGAARSSSNAQVDNSEVKIEDEFKLPYGLGFDDII